MSPRPYFAATYSGLGQLGFWLVDPDPHPYAPDLHRARVHSDPDAAIYLLGDRSVKLSGEIEVEYLYATYFDVDAYLIDDVRLVALPVELEPDGELRVLTREQISAAGDTGFAMWIANAEGLNADIWRQVVDREPPGSLIDELNAGALARQRPHAPRVVWIEGDAPQGKRYARAAVIPTELDSVAGLPVRGIVTTEANTADCDSDSEAHYLCAILNSDYVHKFGETYPWTWGHAERGPTEVVPIPRFDPGDDRHVQLAELSRALHLRAAQLDLGDFRYDWQYRSTLGSDSDTADALVRDVMERA